LRLGAPYRVGQGLDSRIHQHLVPVLATRSPSFDVGAKRLELTRCPGGCFVARGVRVETEDDPAEREELWQPLGHIRSARGQGGPTSRGQTQGID
jgi:hypothetical protein